MAEADFFSTQEHSWNAPASNAWSYEADENASLNQNGNRETRNSYLLNPTSGSTYKPHRPQNASELPTSRPHSTYSPKERQQDTDHGSQHAFRSSEEEFKRLRSQYEDLARKFAEFQQRSQESTPAPSMSQSSPANPDITVDSTDINKSSSIPHGYVRSSGDLRDNRWQSGSPVSNPDRPSTKAQQSGSYSTNDTNLKDNTWKPAEPRNNQISQKTPNPNEAVWQIDSPEQWAYHSVKVQPPKNSEQDPSGCTRPSCKACKNKWGPKRTCLRCGIRIVPHHLLQQHLRDKGHHTDLKTHMPMVYNSRAGRWTVVQMTDKAQPPKDSQQEPFRCLRSSCGACKNKWGPKRTCLCCGRRIVPRHRLQQHLREKGHYIDLKTHLPMKYNS